MHLNIPEQAYVMLGQAFITIILAACLLSVILSIAYAIKDYRDAMIRTKRNKHRIAELNEELRGYSDSLGYEILIIKRHLGLMKEEKTKTEGGNKMIPVMCFGEALEALKQGKKVYRKGWNGVGMWLELQLPDEHSKMTEPYIYIEYPVNPEHHAHPNGFRGPWFASQTDMLAEDWLVKHD